MPASSKRPGRTLALFTAAFVALAALVGGGGAVVARAQGTAAAPAGDLRPRALVFSRTAGFRHQSIPDGVQAITELLAAAGWAVDATEDPTRFTDDNLRRYRCVVFLSTTGNVLDDAQQRAFEAYVRTGGGYAGVHAAADTEYEWPWYGRMVGAWFKGHPDIQQADVKVEDRTHRSTAMLPETWKRTDEWYAFRANPRSDVHVLASLDEKSYRCAAPSTNMGGDHPIAWYHDFDGGRAWYTALGHTKESYAEPLFREHLREGILWAGGEKAAPAPAPAATPAQPAAPGSPVAAPAVPAAPAAPAKGAGAHRGIGILPTAGAPARGLLAQSPTPGSAKSSHLLLIAGIGVGVVLLRAFLGSCPRQTILAWVLPGLGYLALGQKRRGVLVMAGILGMFITGLAVGGVDCVDSDEDWPWFFPQSMNGPIAYAVDAVNQRVVKTGRVGELLPAPPTIDPATGRPTPPTVTSLKGIGAANEFGTLLIALGGLVNLIAILDTSRREPA